MNQAGQLVPLTLSPPLLPNIVAASGAAASVAWEEYFSAHNTHARAVYLLIYTVARAGAVAKLRRKHCAHDGTQWSLRCDEKGGKQREIPVRHDLEQVLRQYVIASNLEHAPGDSPRFRSDFGKSGRLTDHPVTSVDIGRMFKRRFKDAASPNRPFPHSVRVAAVTYLLTLGFPLESVQLLVGHSDERTTPLYYRRQQRVMRNSVERISI